MRTAQDWIDTGRRDGVWANDEVMSPMTSPEIFEKFIQAIQRDAAESMKEKCEQVISNSNPYGLTCRFNFSRLCPPDT